ncbi:MULTISPECIES: glycine betaine ABC transporter substrate-binding protein [Chromohalobacter]|jgi:osmoprotectant transport system substrate-binding protein|uniref:Substrate-binding region of ABC-type glycine betaine transport system n=1 Tax=Chromohalobacter israelensis (strain ATCC BAA-138 / DSM 3043 / CIP 106854 / NCIMB 13768 / 1H11) TaxID=290398 RepID=Q1QV02_CHRI1|nr:MULTISPECIES: glycine betaine ABC transporter substrate-binding protein [Chromohalobacter]ABE59706.1 Substrate-binding region of ABC-type glycine betaine transport system [Chromohalobacter salexigens DSM 3043]NQY47032.1 glycine betaine ABC transporter substrate-binding protein [Chromohalobacter sp.]
MRQSLLPLIGGLALASTLVSPLTSTAAHAEDITVGGKNFTEQLILSSMTTQYLQAHGYEVDQRAGMGTTVLRRAQESGQVDLYWEYTGTSLISYNKVTEDLSPEATYERVKELDAEKGLIWLEPSEANNTYALAMRKDDAEARGIATISDLADVINGGQELVLASNATFYSRDDGLRPMQETYGFEFGRRNVKRMDQGLTLTSLDQEEVDVAMTTATNGRIPALDLTVLEDDKNFFPDYALTPVVREETLEANPDLDERMNALSALLDDSTMARLNAKVDVDKQPVEKVAERFLEEHDLL